MVRRKIKNKNKNVECRMFKDGVFKYQCFSSIFNSRNQQQASKVLLHKWDPANTNLVLTRVNFDSQN